MSLFSEVVGNCDASGHDYVYQVTYIVRNNRVEWSAAANCAGRSPAVLEGVLSLLTQPSVAIEGMIRDEVRETIERECREAHLRPPMASAG